jgi:predicted DCC family thiol-disulfide oxidoreductase YuxK
MCPNQYGSRWVIIYDGRCAFCREQIDKIRRHDKQDTFEYVPNEAPEILSRFPQLVGKDLNAGLWLIAPDKTLYSAADAIYQIVRQLERYKSIAWLYRLPLIHWATQWSYRWIASYRHRL